MRRTRLNDVSQSIELLRNKAGRGLVIALGAAFVATSSGCGALLLIGGAGTSAIAFATGELRTTEEAPLAEVDAACGEAIDRLGYEDVTTEREASRVRYRGRTVGGEPVDIRLEAKEPETTQLRIRIGVFGDEATSRLVLEEIQQSL
jgi:hypothetical protein